MSLSMSVHAHVTAHTCLCRPKELLSYEAGMVAGPLVVDPTTGQAIPSADVYHRGLRVKVGLDCGALKGEINCVTGRMVRVMKGGY